MSLLESFLPIWLIKEIRPPKWKLGVVFIPDSIGYLIGTNLFSLFDISIEYSLLYLALPHFGIGLGIGTIDSTLWPMLAQLVDEQFAAQYGYVYTASQTASSAAYAFGPLFGGTLINRKLIHFESLMRLIGIVNLILGLLALTLHQSYEHFGRKKRTKMINNNDDDGDQQMVALQRFSFSKNYQQFD
ncbi:synaptic vesicular amine transporter-like protein [Euroglyphus maynei]|uniref:Synaptic vesicular amine transporter-like protein n=1 Tax=Euroglyphus maynei TaxID=6958 RepID=A0A1Y3B8G9_EURMA|nr:synaptic vesicular amine transporter-like protein [Euroglyphus maynei]